MTNTDKVVLAVAVATEADVIGLTVAVVADVATSNERLVLSDRLMVI